MFCSYCGKKLSDDAQFCDACGAKVGGNSPKAEGPKQEGKIHKCPNCGELLAHDALKCLSCGYEVRGREVTHSIKEFFEKINTIDDENKKIELIKTYPIPNNREDIFEFMYLASANFDAKYYATNKNKDSVASAWLSKIEQCYQKGKAMLSSKVDLTQLDSLYEKVNNQTKKVAKTRLIFVIAGFVAIAVGLLIVCLWGKDNTAIGAVGIVLIAVGIVGLVLGFKRKKTNKEIEEEKIAKANKKNKSAQNEQTEEVVVKNTIVKQEYDEPEVPIKVSKEEVEPEKEVLQTNETGSVTYPREDVEVWNKFVLKTNEKILVKLDIDYLNDDEEREYEVALTNKALYYLKKDEDAEKIEEVTRIPLCQISQAVYKKGGAFEDKVLEVYREGSVDKIEGNKKLAILETAINDRFDASTVNRDYRYYDNLKI